MALYRYGCSLSLLLCLTLPAPAAVRAAEKIQHIVVLPVTVASGIDKEQGRLLDEVVLGELSAIVPEDIRFVGSADLAAVLNHEQQAQLLDCSETTCLVEIGNALGATHILVPTLGKMGAKFIVTSKFLKVSDATVLHRKVLYTDDNEEKLLMAIRSVVHDLGKSQGWKVPEDSQLPTYSDNPASDPSPGGPNMLLFAGGAVAAVGALAGVGLGIGGVVYDVRMVGDSSLDGQKREQAAGGVALMLAGSAAALLVAAGGGVLAVVALADDGEAE